MVEEAGKPVTSSEEILAQLEVNGRFRPVRIDYQAPFQLVKTDLKKELAGRKKGVAVILLNQPDLSILNPLQLMEAEILLGKRSSEEGKPWGGGTWAPLMGRAEEKDLDLARQTTEARAKDGRVYTHGDLIKEIASRERLEEARITPMQTIIVNCGSFKDLETGWTIHVVAEIIQAVSQEGEKSEKRQLLEGKKTAAVEPDSDEHTEFKWFNLGELPLDEMEPGSKKAIRTALDFLAKKNYITV
jgi:hypothetical protein